MLDYDCRIMPIFELVSKYNGHDELLPKRATEHSAGYDFYVAEDTLVPSYLYHSSLLNQYCCDNNKEVLSLDDVAKITKLTGSKPTLVPTGIKCYLPSEQYLQLSVRSSCPLKYWLILANGVGVIDKDYYNNPDNEGHIYFQIINLFPQDIMLHKGDKIGQGIILPYCTANELKNEPAAARVGGFGSTGA